MHMRRNVLIGCGAFVLIMLMVGATLYLYWTAPPDVPIPPAPASPPDNAYTAYLQLVEKTRQLEASTPNLAQISQSAMSPQANILALRQYVALYAPIRREYRRHLSKPSVVTNANDVRAVTESASAFRTWARVESADIRLAFREGDHARAIDDLRTVLLLAEGIRNGAPFISYLVGEAMIAIGVAAFAEGVDRLSAGECDRLVQVVREWEKVRVPFWKALEGEKRFILAMYDAMYRGSPHVLVTAPPGRSASYLPFSRYLVRMTNLRSASREANRLFDKAIAEARKPLLKRQAVGTPSHALNQNITILFAKNADRSAVSVARLRLIACSAAVRAYRLRHGRYPAMLAEAGVADLNVDPFTGAGFAYRVGSNGFLLYSVGVDGKDDGGKRVPEGEVLKGTGDIAVHRYSPPPGVTTPGPTIWCK